MKSLTKSENANTQIKRPLVKVLGKEIDPEKVESPALKRVLRELADNQTGNKTWDKNWHKHDKCCTGFLFSQ